MWKSCVYGASLSLSFGFLTSLLLTSQGSLRLFDIFPSSLTCRAWPVFPSDSCSRVHHKRRGGEISLRRAADRMKSGSRGRTRGDVTCVHISFLYFLLLTFPFLILGLHPQRVVTYHCKTLIRVTTPPPSLLVHFSHPCFSHFSATSRRVTTDILLRTTPRHSTQHLRTLVGPPPLLLLVNRTDSTRGSTSAARAAPSLFKNNPDGCNHPLLLCPPSSS